MGAPNRHAPQYDLYSGISSDFTVFSTWVRQSEDGTRTVTILVPGSSPIGPCPFKNVDEYEAVVRRGIAAARLRGNAT